MRTLRNLLTTLCLLLLMAHGAHSQTGTVAGSAAKVRNTLTAGWQFREASKDAWHKASVPGCVHTDLLANKLIEDPFYRDNEQKLQWIGKTDWEYKTTFTVAPALLRRQNVELVFEGLDTYAEVFVNGKSLLNADNMFRTWRVDVKSALTPGPNTLLIRFRSPINEVLPLMAKMSYQLPSPNDQGEKTSPHTRKAPYHYGWDWGPRFVTSGVWKPVYLEAWDGARINDLHVAQKQVTTSAAKLTAEVEVVADEEMDATVVVNNLTSKAIAAQSKVKLTRGMNRVPLDFVIQRPSLWWPNGLGRQPLYSFRARLLVNGKLSDEARTRTGLRSLELRQQPDQWGKSFEFRVNNVPVFAKGGNWIPSDSFPTRVTKERYKHLLESVRDTNMNMLRVWGGGIYESDEFYKLCDEMGLLVWQDFMFACSMYPGDQKFLDNVRAEAVDNVKRLRNHPSLVIWAGNNEVETAWQHWGWKQNLPASLWDDYLKLFHGVLKEVTAELDPTRPYWPSSPSSNLEDDSDSQKIGDVHYWEVWHASKPFEFYEKQFPRFMSEYGFQSFPQIETVSTYTLPTERDIQSPVMLAHQRHPRGNQLIREYMLREYPEPKDFESFLYVSQVLQAEGIRTGAEHLRRIMPRNMGSLYWQINDCWPVASWSSIDYYGRWKALQYYARRFHTDLLVSPHREEGNLDFYVVSDRTTPAEAELRVRLMDFDGNFLKSDQRSVTVAPLQSKVYLSLPVETWLEGRDAKKVLLAYELSVGGKVVSANNYFFEPYKNLSIPAPQIGTEVVRTRRGFRVAMTSDKFARAVYLSLTNGDGFFSDNYFDILPGQQVEVEFRPRAPMTLTDFRSRLKVRSMKDAF
ncbi:MAG TPA: glycoside hydrolase family 2 protein [Pyrinomonadaceae bacterium]|nr:glycoside hydrolase family 2 protein [Pyrinomonadaceae bacterium]